MDIRAMLMGLAFALMWSSAFTSARIIVQDAPPLASLSLRFFLSGLIGVAIARALGQHWNLTRAQWRAVFVFGLCQNALYLGLNFVAMQTVEASLASIIASSMPLIVAGAGWLFLKDRLPTQGVIGLVLGVVGVVIIMGARFGGEASILGMALCVAGALALAVATLTMRGASSGGNLLMIVGLQMFVGAIILGVVSAASETLTYTPSLKLTLAFAYTTLVPGLLATFVWFSLVERIGAVRASTFHFLNPFFGVAIAALLLGEALGIMDVIGVTVITIGILLVQLSKQKPTGS
ncbi:DMT family transporter [Planktotalea arctica]|uniref:DMT family transporter n=1 Tax=Planktotalea arctica TaxID=1481893 RepID=UPI000A176C74|nr:DMT family transporter [Planktotalea arctica]